MKRWVLAAFLLLACVASAQTLILYEDGFPSADSAAPSRQTLAQALPDAEVVNETGLAARLAAPDVKLLILPYGSAFPEDCWTAIYAYLQRGGSLLVLGGKPFSRAAYKQDGIWKLREDSVRFTRPLLINGYSTIEGFDHSRQAENVEVPVSLPHLPVVRAFSPIIRMSTKDIYPAEGSAGSLDARLDPIVWSGREGDHTAAPVIAIDHLHSTFAGGRWVFVQSDVPKAFFDSADGRGTMVELAKYAARGAEDFSARTMQATYLPNEPIELRVVAHSASLSSTAQAEIKLTRDGRPDGGNPSPVPARDGVITLPTRSTPGLYNIETRFSDNGKLLRVDQSAFWIRDDKLLNSGARFGAGGDFFQFDGKPTAIVGTTYMSRDVQRLFLQRPNVAVWDSDMAQIRASGLNLIRTGLWSGWRDVTNDDGSAKEAFLRNLEAFLLTARRHDLQVQFTFFSFLPDSFGGTNPYLDPDSVEHQRHFVRSIAQRVKDVPYLSYDLINEPSISQFTWRTRPNGDKLELAAWNIWLKRRYADWSALAEAWNVPTLGAVAPLPSPEEFAPRGAYFGNSGLKVHDYYVFAQDVFSDWTRNMVATIHDAGSRQLITVGQDDGGYQERLNPAFFADALDFTTNHTWWLNDDLLWCSLIAKQQGKPMLIQETGLQRQLTPRETARRTTESEAGLLERKLAMSFAGGAGAVEWLWNVNPYMTSDNEVTIGAVRADGTLKADVEVLRNIAAFAKDASSYLNAIEPPQVAIVTSQALQYSPWSATANAAQQRAVRAMFYDARVPAYIIAENQISKLGHPRLAVLPSPQALSDAAWQALMQYVRDGGHLLITGPVERDEHWRLVRRAAEAGIKAELVPLTFHQGQVKIAGETLSFQFDETAQENLDTFAFDGSSQFIQAQLGKGAILWIAYPIELSENEAETGKVYAYAARQAGLRPMVSPQSAPSGVLIYPQPMKHAVLYIFESESDVAAPVVLRDPATHANLHFTLPAQRAAMAVIRRTDGKIVARYGF